MKIIIIIKKKKKKIAPTSVHMAVSSHFTLYILYVYIVQARKEIVMKERRRWRIKIIIQRQRHTLKSACWTTTENTARELRKKRTRRKIFCRSDTLAPRGLCSLWVGLIFKCWHLLKTNMLDCLRTNYSRFVFFLMCLKDQGSKLVATIKCFLLHVRVNLKYPHNTSSSCSSFFLNHEYNVKLIWQHLELTATDLMRVF